VTTTSDHNGAQSAGQTVNTATGEIT
jgi:hypothetical protein